MYLEYVLHPQELAQYERDVTQLTTEVEQLRKEKANLLGEVEAHKLTVSSYHVIVMHVSVTFMFINWWRCSDFTFLVCSYKVTRLLYSLSQLEKGSCLCTKYVVVVIQCLNT